MTMNIVDSYSKYRKERLKYPVWKDKRNRIEAQRLAFINNNGITAKERHSDIQRAEAILNCIDVMDEFSQTRAEDMEIVTEQGKSIISGIGTYLSMGIGALWIFISKTAKNTLQELKQQNFKVLPKLILPTIIISAPMFASFMIASLWGAGKEIKASQVGRAEAINTKLYSPKQFAELTDEQEKQVDEIAKTIQLSSKEAKKDVNAGKGLGIFKSIKIMFSNNTKEIKTINNISYRIKQDQECFDKLDLSDKEIEEAKKDKQLIQNVVEKIDIASQDYAEDVELATSALTTTALAGGFISGWITNKLLTKIPSLAKFSAVISVLVGAALVLGTSIPCAKVQKQASRVGRFKVKQDFINHPEKLIYVDDDKITNEDGTKYMNNNKKPGFFKFLSKIFKENKEYNNYLKTEYVESQKRSKAREEIEITPEQEKRARQLQINTFKMFNKLDEKSQSFSESVEAMGEIVSNSLVTVVEYIGMAISMILLSKSNSKGNILKSLFPIFAALGVAIPLNVYITKEQKHASKVANMLAINEMDDYRNFADFSKFYPTIINKAE